MVTRPGPRNDAAHPADTDAAGGGTYDVLVTFPRTSSQQPAGAGPAGAGPAGAAHAASSQPADTGPAVSSSPDVSARQHATAGRRLRVGILALQGDVREHARAMEEGGAEASAVRRPAELAVVDALIIPGGESTTIDKLTRSFGMAGPIKERIAAGMPVFGSCAGMIMLADEIADAALDSDGLPQQSFGGLDITVRRNAFGRQRESFERVLEFPDPAPTDRPGLGPDPFTAVFIRAPWAERAGAGVQVLATVHAAAAPDRTGPEGPAPDEAARIVAVRTQHLLATSFHPEVTGERRIHELFLRMIRGEA